MRNKVHTHWLSEACRNKYERKRCNWHDASCYIKTQARREVRRNGNMLIRYELDVLA